MTTLTTGAERQLAVERWLLSTVPDRRRVREEWRERPFAMLPCGSLFAAVRIPSSVVRAAAGGEGQDPDQFLADALMGGPVICDRYAALYYALVPASAVRLWAVPDTVCLGRGAEVGVPRPGVSAADTARVYWSVPMDSAGELCSPAAVSQTVMVGRYALAVAHG
ncbi:hypothetical protein [Streptomyces laculatispora]|uniref:hypothetical protein n=1 Tax=Streptomyces laculatispora TaxID=887464 RepID=UPI001A94F8B2|nr:hypothetical protein [Streptomyces laculatispora]MBO0918090.1 hypothetical protein [Streptomyces laculatispora]